MGLIYLSSIEDDNLLTVRHLEHETMTETIKQDKKVERIMYNVNSM